MLCHLFCVYVLSECVCCVLDGFVALLRWGHRGLAQCYVPALFYSLCHHYLQVYSPVETIDRTFYMPFCSTEIIHVWLYLTVLTACVSVGVCLSPAKQQFYEICVIVLLQCGKAHKSDSSSPGPARGFIMEWVRKKGEKAKERRNRVGGSERERKGRRGNESERTRDWKRVGGAGEMDVNENEGN